MRELRTDALDAGYDGVALVSGIELAARPGKIVALVGPNGAGKSTILRTLAGTLAPVKGVVLFDGAELTKMKLSERAKALAVMTTRRADAEYATCYDVVGVGRYQFTGIFGRLGESDARAIDDALRLVGAFELRDADFSRLSDGQKQRVLLARALVQEPEIMLLDEPTSYLDVGGKLDFVATLKKLARERGIGVVAALHELELVRTVADEVVCVTKDGRIDRTGTVAEIFQSEYLKKLFDARSDAFDTTYGFMTPSGSQRANASPRVCVGNGSSRVKYLMVQGTMSSAGKSLIVAGLCRILRQDGFRVAPFKSQNMALNSFVTEDGLEMGRAQVMQAEACGIKPSVLMNPILLKPTDDCGSQVIVNGAVVGNMRAREYFEYKTRLTPTILSAVEKLGETSDVIVLEGAGSPAEINLKRNDIVNMGMARLVDAPVLLVGDIDRGGVFAQLLGTLELLEPDERARVKGLIVNKFRGDKTILDPGVAELEKRGGVPVAGVIPYMTLTLADEDSLTERFERRGRGLVNIGVVQLSHLSNFTDFDVFEQVKGVAVTYVKRPEETRGFDLLILPGSKNTIADVRRLRESGFESAIRAYAESGAPVIGVCGGFQALGETIADPDGVEGGGSIAGLGLLPVATTLRTQKRRRQTTGSFVAPDGPLASLAGLEFSGYEIHMGETVATRAGTSEFTSGATGLCRGNVYGTYVHGVFDGESVVKTLIATLASRKGVAVDLDGVVDYRTLREREYDRLAATMREHLNMALIYDALGVERHD